MSPLRRARHAAPLLLAAWALTACRAPAVALGTPTVADQFLASLAARFGPHDRDARLDALRPRFAKAALTPSRLFRDRSAWTATDHDTRTLTLAGAGTPDHYRLAITAGAPPPLHPADYRRVMLLTHLGGDDYEWNVRDELGVGAITGADLGRALTALLGSLGGLTGGGGAAGAVRRDLPRTAAALGRLLALDTVRLTPNVAGGTDVRITATIHADRAATTFPHLAHYFAHYVAPTDGDLAVLDDAGRTWWTAAKHDDAITIALRVNDGTLAPLAGPPQRMPDHLRVHIDGSTHTFIFHVGMRDLVGTAVVSRAAHDNGFEVAFQQEPDWKLPPLVEQMLRSPLRRPFEGNGARLSFAIHDGDGALAPTVIVRDYDLTVRESRIMRWLGGLGDAAIEDFRTGAEADFDRFTGEALLALRADVAALASPTSPAAGP